MNDRFLFATAPVSWGVGDYADESWEQPYEGILDEIAGCGYTGTELGPFGYFPTDPDVLRPVLERRGLKMLSSFVPVALADAGAAAKVIEHIRQVGALLSAMGAPCIVLADEQSPQTGAHRRPRPGGRQQGAERAAVAQCCQDRDGGQKGGGGFRAGHRLSSARRYLRRDAGRGVDVFRRDVRFGNRLVPGYRPLLLRRRRPGRRGGEV